MKKAIAVITTRAAITITSAVLEENALDPWLAVDVLATVAAGVVELVATAGLGKPESPPLLDGTVGVTAAALEVPAPRVEPAARASAGANAGEQDQPHGDRRSASGGSPSCPHRRVTHVNRPVPANGLPL